MKGQELVNASNQIAANLKNKSGLYNDEMKLEYGKYLELRRIAETLSFIHSSAFKELNSKLDSMTSVLRKRIQ